MALKLGDINFSLGADDKGLRSSVKTLERFGRLVERTSGEQAKGSAKAAAALRRQERAVVSALKRVQDLNAASRRLGADPTNIAASNRAFRAFNKVMTTGTLTALQFQRAQGRLSTSLGNVSRRLKDVASKKHTQQTKDLADRMRNLASAASLGLGPLNGLAARLTAFATAAKRAGLATAAMLVGFAAATVGIFKLGSATIRNARALGIVRSQLDAITGSTMLTARAFAEVVDISRRSGQALNTVGTQYAKFMAAVRGSNLEGSKSREIFESVALTIGKLQLPAEQAQGIFRALEQIMSKGTVQAEELRNQLGDRLPGAFGLAARAMRVTTQKLGEMLKQGEVLSEDFLPKFADQLKKSFDVGGRIDTLQSAFNNLATSASLFLDKLDSLLGISNAFQAALNGISNALDFMTKNLESLIASLGAVAGAFLALSGGAIVAGLIRVGVLIRGLATAVLALNVAILANPVGLLTTALIRLGTALAGALAGFFGLKALLGEAASEFSALITEVDAFHKATERLRGSVGGTGESIKQNLIDSVAEARIQVAILTAQLRNLSTENRIIQFFRNLNTAIGLPGESVKKLTKEIQKFREQETIALGRLIQLEKDLLVQRKRTAAAGADDALSKAAQKQQVALEKANLQLARMKARLEAIRTGGTEALELLNRKFAQTDKIEKFRELLEKTGLATSIIKKRVDEFAEALTQLDALKEPIDAMGQLMERFQEVASRAFDRVGDALGDMVISGKFNMKTFQNLFRTFVGELLKEAIKILIIRQLVGAIFGAFGGFGAGAGTSAGGATTGAGGGAPATVLARKGAAFDGGVQKMAKGGVLTRATLFASASGPVIGGEAGKEAILPLQRTASGDLGVQAIGGGNGGKTFNIVYNIDARSADPGVEQRIRRMLVAIDRSIEPRAENAVQNRNFRDPTFLT